MSKPTIDCSMFLKAEELIKGITSKINRAKGISEKAGFAEELKKIADELLSCQEFESGNLNCKNCHFIAALRKKTADIIIKVKRLA